MSRLDQIVFFLICTIAVVAVMAYGTVHQPVIALFYLSVTLAALLFVSNALIGGKLTLDLHPIQLPIGLLALYGLIQIIPFGSRGGEALTVPNTISYDPFATAVTALHISAILIFLVIAASSLNSEKRVRRFGAVACIFGFTYAFYAILQSVLSPERIYGIYKPSAGIPFGSFVNKHDFAAVIEMLIAIPIGILLVGGLRSDKKLLYGVAVAIMGAALLLSGSRGGLIAAFAEVAFLLLITNRGQGSRSFILKASLAAVLAVSAIGGAIFVGGDTTLTRISETVQSDDVTSSRIQIWSVTLDVIRDGMPFGVGLGAYPFAYTKFDPSGGFERVEQAHNDYLQIVADAGLVGAILAVAFLYFFFRLGTRAIRGPDDLRRGIAVGAFAGCFSVLIHSMFDFVLHITGVTLVAALLIAVLIACERFAGTGKDSSDDGRRRRRRSASVTPIDARGI